MYDLAQAKAKNAKVISPANGNMSEISFFDVKELYEIAYAKKDEEGCEISEFHLLLARAQKMDDAYRAQLALKTGLRYKIGQKAA